MRIYIATSREQAALAKDYAERLEAVGFEITQKWWDDIEQQAAIGIIDGQVPLEDLLPFAEADRLAVETSDIFWILAPIRSGTGCWVELGMALSCEIPIIMSGCAERTLFSSLPEITRFSEHDIAVQFLTTICRAGVLGEAS